jgi:hypothetical protein
MSEFMSKDNMMEVCGALYAAIERDPRLKRAADSQDLPLKALVYDVMHGIEMDPEFRDADTGEKNRVVVMFGTRMYENHVGTDEPGPGPEPAPTGPPEGVKEDPLDAATIEERMRSLAVQTLPIQAHRQLSVPDRHTEYLSLDSGDRDHVLHPKRYEYVVKLDPLRSVAKLRVWNLTIPLGPSDPAVLSVRANVSHLWLWIEEVSGAYSKNVADVARRAFCKLIMSYSHEPANGRGYLMYEPVMEDARTFSPPLASLSTLTLSLRRPDGSLVDGSRDDFRLTSIHKNSDADANWVLNTDRCWEDASFMTGDVLRLSEIDTGFVELNGFLNSTTGHIVLAVGYPLGTSYRSLIIRKPGVVDQATGIFEGDTKIHEQLQAATNFVGRILNLSMQVSISMSAECEVDQRHVDPTLGQNLPH